MSREELDRCNSESIPGRESALVVVILSVFIGKSGSRERLQRT